MLFFWNGIMHSFSIHTPQGAHIGFLVLVSDDETRQHGSLMLRGNESAEAAALAAWQECALTWHWQGDAAEIRTDNGTPAGSLKAEHLNLGGHTFILNDLTGQL